MPTVSADESHCERPHSHSPLVIFPTMAMWENIQCTRNNIVMDSGKNIQESMDKFTDCCDVTEILFETALYGQSANEKKKNLPACQHSVEICLFL